MTLAADHRWTLGECATLACLLECTAAKPGNVHRGADFEDCSYLDFVLSANAIGPVFDRASTLPLGQLVLHAVQATRRYVGSNTNLGMILLLAPLAKVPREQTLEAGIHGVLQGLVPSDCALVYEAIRAAKPGGLGEASEGDIAGPAPDDLLAAMRMAADRDLVARQYANDFAEVLTRVVPALVEGLDRGWPLQTAIIQTQLKLMSELPDTLIARKCGIEVAQQSAEIACAVLNAGDPNGDSYAAILGELDFWLRCDGHRRNPGTTADLIAAGLFCLLRDGRIQVPWKFY